MPSLPLPPSLDHNCHPKYRPDIDGLRAIAVLAVVAFHAFPGRLPGGFIGVDIFFVISGYLISNIIFRSLADADFSFAEFYAHRVKRIFPALIVMLAGVLVIGYFVLLPGEFKQLGRHVVRSAGFIENFMLVQDAGYFDVATERKPLMHLWSLGIEEQFYIAYPFILWLGWRMGFNLLFLVAAIAVSSFALNVSGIDKHAVSTFLLPQPRFWELMAGGLLSWIHLLGHERFKPLMKHGGFGSGTELGQCQSSLLANAMAFAGLLLIALALFLINKMKAFPGWWALLPVVGAWLVIAAGPMAWANRKILAHKATVFVGLISYPLYLWHWPLLSYAQIIASDTPPREIRLMAVAMAFLLAWLTYRLIERPIRFGRKTWIKTATLCVLLVAVAGAGEYIRKKEGLPIRTGPLRQVAEQFEWPDKNQTDCVADFPWAKDGYCLRSKAGPAETVLIGDSHANALYPGLSELYQATNTGLMQLGNGGCVPFYGLASYEKGQEDVCERLIGKALDLVIQESSVNRVILSSRGPLYLTLHGFGQVDKHDRVLLQTNHPEETDTKRIFVGAMRDTLARLVAARKRVIFTIDVPELGFDPKACIEVWPIRLMPTKAICAVPRSAVDARNQEYWTVIHEILHEFPTVKVFNPVPYLCDAEYCWAMKDGKLLYRDHNHLSVFGSRYIAKRMADELNLP